MEQLPVPHSLWREREREKGGVEAGGRTGVAGFCCCCGGEGSVFLQPTPTSILLLLLAPPPSPSSSLTQKDIPTALPQFPLPSLSPSIHFFLRLPPTSSQLATPYPPISLSISLAISSSSLSIHLPSHRKLYTLTHHTPSFFAGFLS